MSTPPQPTWFVISQVFEPDPAAVGQYLADAARRLAARNWRVVVYTADRGYDDPARRYPRRERVAGVDVRRTRWSSTGKRSTRRRIAGQVALLAQATVRGLFTRNLAGVLISTSPPMAAAAALPIGWLRRVPVVYWPMDINPDQAIVTGEIGPGSLLVKALEALNRMILRRAAAVVTLDRFMAERLRAKATPRGPLEVIPPWPLGGVEAVPPAHNPFRERLGLTDHRLVMYSGNHSPHHPLDTLLAAVVRVADHPRLRFAFVGGGGAKAGVDEAIVRHRLTNAISLPYQPRAEISSSLSAADVHVVAMGDDQVGLVHPSKIYNAIALARPLLVLGPPECHAAELVREHGIGWVVRHDDVDRMVEVLEEIAVAAPHELAAMGERAARLAAGPLSAAVLARRFCDVLEEAAASAR